MGWSCQTEQRKIIFEFFVKVQGRSNDQFHQKQPTQRFWKEDARSAQQGEPWFCQKSPGNWGKDAWKSGSWIGSEKISVSSKT